TGAQTLGEMSIGYARGRVQVDRNLLRVAPDLLQLLDLGRREAELGPPIEHERDERALGAGVSRGEVATEAIPECVELDGEVIEGTPHLLVRGRDDVVRRRGRGREHQGDKQDSKQR